MWKKAGLYAALASVALNVAFVAMWIAHAAPLQDRSGGIGQRAAERSVWCPLHRQLQVTGAQWRQIEPRLRDFQTAVGELCRQVDRLRSEVIDLVAAEEPDVEAIRAKQDEILATKRQIQRRVVDHLLAEKEILTPEQQERLFGMLRDRTGCIADPPMSNPPRGGLGRVLQHRDAIPANETD